MIICLLIFLIILIIIFCIKEFTINNEIKGGKKKKKARQKKKKKKARKKKKGKKGSSASAPASSSAAEGSKKEASEDLSINDSKITIGSHSLSQILDDDNEHKYLKWLTAAKKQRIQTLLNVFSDYFSFTKSIDKNMEIYERIFTKKPAEYTIADDNSELYKYINYMLTELTTLETETRNLDLKSIDKIIDFIKREKIILSDKNKLIKERGTRIKKYINGSNKMIYIINATISYSDCDVIVNAANESGLWGNGIDGIISCIGKCTESDSKGSEKNPIIQYQYLNRKPTNRLHLARSKFKVIYDNSRIKTGKAKLTLSYSGHHYSHGDNYFSTKFIIHAVGPNYKKTDDTTGDSELKSAYESIFNLIGMSINDNNIEDYCGFIDGYDDKKIIKEKNIHTIGIIPISIGIYSGNRDKQQIVNIGLTEILKNMRDVYIYCYDEKEFNYFNISANNMRLIEYSIA
jgi:O-acetyl-ADP-ribose deacetylase (regulator of RNase III)